jgi:hypothetical protein
MRAIYVADTEGVVALAAATTAKTIFGVKADAGHAIDLLGLAFSLDGVAAAEKPVFVEFCYCTFGANPPGTASTAVTIDSEAGPRVAETMSAGKNWTTEPTTITALRPLDCDPYKFYYEKDHPLGESPDGAAAEGFAIRMTIPSGGAAVNARVWARWARV